MFNAIKDEARRHIALDLPDWIKLGISGGALVWGWLAPLDQLLVILIVLDIVSGMICSGINGTLNSDASFKGMLKKTLILLLVAMAHAIDPYASTLLQMGSMNVSIAAAVTAFFAVNECLSILENAANAGVPIPQFLRDALLKVKS